MVEPRIVVPVVAGSSPVGHPKRGLRPHLLPPSSLKGIDHLPAESASSYPETAGGRDPA
jgi:hypothetical protein